MVCSKLPHTSQDVCSLLSILLEPVLIVLVSGGGLTTVGLATNGFPPVQQLISGGQLNLTRNLESFDAILPGKAELGFSIAFVFLFRPELN